MINKHSVQSVEIIYKQSPVVKEKHHFIYENINIF